MTYYLILLCLWIFIIVTLILTYHVETGPCYEAQTGLKLEILKLLNIGIASLCRHAQLFCIFMYFWCHGSVILLLRLYNMFY